MQNNLISVVIPMYNAEKTILRAINSVINQTYDQPVEIIVVNDGSKDNSENVVGNFIRENPNVNLKLISQVNGGVSKARNAGLKNVKGDFVAFLDSDDEWFSDKLEKQIKIFQTNSEVDFLGTGFEGFRLNNKKEGEIVKIDFRKLLFKNYFQPSTVVFRREVFDVIGYFDESQRYAEEGNFFLRIAHEYNCYFLNSNCIVFGDGKEGFGVSGLSSNLKEMERGELKNLRFVYRQSWVNIFTYLIAVTFSILKYFRRIIIVKLR